MNIENVEAPGKNLSCQSLPGASATSKFSRSGLAHIP
jgi:hypothetical protein